MDMKRPKMANGKVHGFTGKTSQIDALEFIQINVSLRADGPECGTTITKQH